MSALVPRLELRQSQSLVMTHQLQQSIKLLQLSSLELTEYIDQEMEKNPLLTAEEPEQPAEKEDGDPEGEASRMEQDESGGEPEPADSPDKPADDWRENDGEIPGYDDAGMGSNYETPMRRRISDEESGMESFTAHEVSLREHLADQLNIEISDPALRLIGQHLIDLADESGYIKEDVSALMAQLGCDEAMIEAAFATLHTFDPPGVCARNLAECLSIQLREKDRLDPAMQILLQHLDLIAKSDMRQLCGLCGVDEEDVKDMCAEIRALNPRPGSGFQHETVQSIEPDVFLRPARGGGGWQVELNSGVLPRVLVNRRYYSQISGKTRDRQEKKYLSDQLAAANWLVKALDQRAQTILKVSTEIVTRQDAFFRDGIRYLRPLTLREVADSVELHESTVSRVTTNKFMATPRGVFELKYFFNASIGNISGGENYSNRTVQHMIKEMIDKEAGTEVLSDDTIAERLKERGIDIARRTVAKYRELLRIPSSSVRRREKMAKI